MPEARPVRAPVERPWLVPSALLAVLMALCVLLAALAPSLAPVPPAASAAPAAPLHLGTVPPFSPALAHYPYVDRAVPARCRAALADYDRLRIFEPPAAARMVRDALTGLAIPSTLVDAAHAWQSELLTGRAESDPAAGRTLAAVAAVPGNVPCLNNLAVALFLLDTANAYGTPVRSLAGVTLPTNVLGPSLQDSALSLWFGLNQERHTDRGLLLNTSPGAGPPLVKWVHGHPNDVDARVLLVQAEITETGDGLHFPDLRRTILPLERVPRTAALGHVLLGDFDLQLVQQVPAGSYLPRRQARAALVEYDRALGLSSDPSAFAGRAAALAALHDPAGAVAAQQQAAARDTQPIGPLVTEAYLAQESGDVAGMRAAATRAYTLALGWDPLVRSVAIGGPFNLIQPLNSVPPLGDVAVIAAAIHGGGGAGGNYEVFNSIARVDPAHVARAQNAPSSVQLALQAKLNFDLLQAPGAVDGDISRWQHALPHLGMGSLQIWRRAAHWLQGKRAPYDSWTLAVASNELRDAGLFARAHALCTRFIGRQTPVTPAPGAPVITDPLPGRCAAETQFFLAPRRPGAARAAGIERAASAFAAETRQCRLQCNTLVSQAPATLMLETATAYHLAGLARQSAAAGPPPGGHVHRSAAAWSRRQRMMARRDLAQARAWYIRITAQTLDLGSAAAAWEKLGDLELDSGRPGRALPYYATAQAAAAGGLDPFQPPPLRLDAQQTAEQAANNSGIAHLRLIQPEADARPDCARQPLICQAALGQFAAARRIDPANPIFAMNTGWVDRLLGREEEARAALSSAVEVDPSLYPALNDLGVLEAEDGEVTAARAHLRAALAAAPRYDLAAWNLGVLDMRQGAVEAPAGQAYLARATAENRSLRGGELEFRTDERFYRYLSGVDVSGGAPLGRAYGIAGAAFGWIALLAALIQAIRTFLTDKGVERAADWWDEREPEWRKKLGERLKKAKISGPKWTWRSNAAWQRLEPWLITVPVLVFAVVLGAARTTPTAIPAAVALVLFATLVAVVTHETGHLLAARAIKARVTRAYWTPGVSLAFVLALVPLEMNTGPYLGHEVEGDEKRAWQVYLSGPVANVILAAVLYGLFLVQPLPLFRLMVQVQLAVAAYSLLPIKPLDGEELEHRPRVALPLAILLTAASLALVLGIM